MDDFALVQIAERLEHLRNDSGHLLFTEGWPLESDHLAEVTSLHELLHDAIIQFILKKSIDLRYMGVLRFSQDRHLVSLQLL